MLLIKRIQWQKVLALLVVFLAVEIWSYLAFSLPGYSHIIYFFILSIFLIVSLYKLEYALLALFAELIVGSMGHLFYLDFDGFRVSIRIGFWLIVMTVFATKFIYQLAKKKRNSEYLQRIISFPYLKILSLLLLVFLYGFLKGVMNEQAFSSVFSDFNSYLFLLLVFPFLALIDLKKEKVKEGLKIMILAALIWLSIKTMFLLAVFSHNLVFAADMYYWLRRTLVGEMTAGTWPRIFIQSQIFSVSAYIFVFWIMQTINDRTNRLKDWFRTTNWTYLLLSSLFFTTVILSFSRSFWLALFLVISASIVYIWRLYNFKRALYSLLWLLMSVIISFAFIYSIILLPISDFGAGSLNKGLSERISRDSSEPALASRWSLLPVLWGEIKQAPILGKGFGAELVYVSSDPRVLENNPSGHYSTYAFEWGYLDIWLKIGVLGLILYLLFLSRIFILGIIYAKKANGLYIASSFSLLFLVITHFFTPYLNHPLGLGLLIILTCIICENDVYLITKNRDTNKL